MITISEVAELANVSKATVSRVLNHTGYVNEQTRRRVEAVIRAHHYSPSASAVNLSRQQTNTIGVLVPEITNAFFGQVLHGISKQLDGTDFTLLYFNSDNDTAKEARALRALAQQRVRGLVLTPARDSDAASIDRLRERIDQMHVPTVLLDRDIPDGTWDGVFFENFQSGCRAAEALIHAGNRRLGIITGDLNLKIARDRRDGFLHTAQALGCPVAPQHIYPGDFTVEGGYRAAKQLFASQPRPQAVLTCNNLISLGFLKAVSEQGLRIGHDIAVIGIDQIPELDYIDYGFSCIARDTEQMGRLAIRVLLERMQHPEEPPRMRTIPFQLRLMGSEKTDG